MKKIIVIAIVIGGIIWYRGQQPVTEDDFNSNIAAELKSSFLASCNNNSACEDAVDEHYGSCSSNLSFIPDFDGLSESDKTDAAKINRVMRAHSSKLVQKLGSCLTARTNYSFPT